MGSGLGMKPKSQLDKVYGEIDILRRVQHLSCVKLRGIFDEAADQDGKLYLLLDFAEGGASMFWDAKAGSYRSSAAQAAGGGLFGEALASAYTRCVLEGFAYLHSSDMKIAHRDIKPQNLLICGTGVLKISDFGVAIAMKDDFIVRGTEGTYPFYSPEMCAAGYEGHDGRKADIWALGVTLWAWMFGGLPFYDADLVKLLDAIAEAKFQLPPAAAALAEPSRRFLLRLLTVDADRRSLSEELLQDSWVAGA